MCRAVTRLRVEKEGVTCQRRQRRREAGGPAGHGWSPLHRAWLGRYQYLCSLFQPAFMPPTLAHTDTQQMPHSHILKCFEQLTLKLCGFSRSELTILFFWCMSCMLWSQWPALTPHIITNCFLSRLINLGKKKRWFYEMQVGWNKHVPVTERQAEVWFNLREQADSSGLILPAYKSTDDKPAWLWLSTVSPLANKLWPWIDLKVCRFDWTTLGLLRFAK